MSNEIKLSPKYGVNPTIPICFWCGEDRNEIALMGHIGDGRGNEDFEAPMHSFIDYEPCDKCREIMGQGVTVIAVTSFPNVENQPPIREGIYPAGEYVVMRKEAAKRVFPGIKDDMDKAFLDREIFEQMFSEHMGL